MRLHFFRPGWALSAAAALLVGCSAAGTTSRTQTFPLHDAQGLVASKAHAAVAQYLGRSCVRLTMEGDDHDGLALLPGVDFQDGVIEADIALRVTLPPGVRFPGFMGIAFRVRPDASHFDLLYVRPGNSNAPDQAMRNHAVQYIAAPDFGWYRLRREWPWVYEAGAELATDRWTHLRIEVAGRNAKLYVNGATRPSLVVNDLRGEDLHGTVGLWGFTDEEVYFSNVRVTPAAPQPVVNGSDVTGAWEMHYSSDAGGVNALMELHRDGNNVSGTWTGPFGEGRAVTGTWREGHVELMFPGEWPKEMPRGVPGPVDVFLSGWIDGDAAQGRMRVQQRSDGVWSAKRKK